MTTYTHTDNVLLSDGEPVLVVPGATEAEMVALVADYQATADAPKSDPDLALYRRMEGDEIEVARDKALDAGVAWNGKRWYADSVFQTQITAYVVAFLAGILPAGATVGVRALDKSINLLSLDQLKQLAAVLLSQVQQVYTTSWAEKAAVDSKGLRDFDKVSYGKGIK